MRTEQIDVAELLVELIRRDEERLGDLVQALENVLYVRDILKTLNVPIVTQHP